MERSFDWLWDKYKEGARDKFEEVCYKIYKNEHPSAEVKRVRVNQGDGGIDVYIDYGDRYIVAQCKFFRYEVGKSQKDQIISSFKSVDKDDLNEWVLCIPIIMDNKEASWWRKWKKRNEEEFGIAIKLHDEDDLIDLLKKHDLYDEYFETVRLDKNFFSNNAKDNEKAKMRELLFPVMNLISQAENGITLIEEIDAVQPLNNHKFFEQSGLIVLLGNLSEYISHWNNRYNNEKPDNYEEVIYKLRTQIVEEYQKLDLSY